MTTRLFILLIPFLLPVGIVFAQPGGTAVVVGIADFEDPGITDLRYTTRDARAFADYLRHPERGGVPPRRVKVLLDSAATLAAIQSALAWQLETATPGAPSYLYLATHGDVEAEHVNTGGFLLAHDTPRNNYELLALSVSYLNDHLRRLAEKGVTAVVVTDACHAGTLAGDAVSGRTLTAARLMRQLDREVRLLSCQPYELAREGERWGEGRGAFSYHLIRGLEGAADTDRDRQIDLFELERYVAESVSADTEREQHPALVGGRKDWSLFTVSAEGQEAILEERTEAAEADFLAAQLALTSPETQRTYLRFRRALGAGKLITPSGSSARDHFYELRGDPEVLRLRGLLDADFTVSLLDSVQQAIQDYLEADASELMRREQLDEKYLAFPEFLAEAAAIVGEADPRYTAIEAKRLYFEGLSRRLRTNFVVQTDSLLTVADSFLTAAVALAPEAAYVQNERGIVKEELGDYAAARTAYERARALAPTWALPHNNLGKLLVSLNPEENADSAALHYERAIQLKPDLATAYMNYGNLMEFQERYDTAETLLRQAVERAPNYVEGWYNLAVVVVKSPETRAEAIELYRRVIAARPEFMSARFGVGYAYEQSGELDSAAAVYRRILAVKNSGMETYGYHGLNRIYQQTDPEAGRTYFRALMDEQPRQPYGYAYTAALDTTDRRWLRKLARLKLSPSEHFALITGVVIELYGYQDLNRAVAGAQLGVKLYPEEAEAHRNLAEILLLCERFDEAAASVRRALTVARKNGMLEEFCTYIHEASLYEPVRTEKFLGDHLSEQCSTAE
jgi:Flp pilus assembly protein TadD